MNDHTNAGRRTTTAPLLPAIPGLAWTQIRAAAVELATHGWPVLPGTYQLDADGEWLGKIGTIGLEPAADLWQLATTTDPNVAMDWWTRRPYSIFLACGTRVDAVEVSAEHGQLALGRFQRTERGPVVATPFGSWLFFVRHDDESMRPDLIARMHAQVHRRGKWLPLPPTAREGVSYRWLVAPSSVGWTLPTSVGVQRALAASIDDRAGDATPQGA
jgi:hypothetical protein